MRRAQGHKTDTRELADFTLVPGPGSRDHDRHGNPIVRVKPYPGLFRALCPGVRSKGFCAVRLSVQERVSQRLLSSRLELVSKKLSSWNQRRDTNW